LNTSSDTWSSRHRTPESGLTLNHLNAFTIDVEDYFQVSAFEKFVPRQQWSEYESRVVQNTHVLLDLLRGKDVLATFFILGWVAERYPQLVREIHEAGHEIGSHGYWHRLIYEQTPDEFREDLVRSRDVLQEIIGSPVTAFRAPSFSVTRNSLWAFEILIEEGFLCDSSVFPIHHDRYGIPDAAPRVHMVKTPSGQLWEFPPSVVRMGPVNFPVSGGGYFRLYPFAFTARWLSAINRKVNQPFMFYIHPWEVDPDQPRLGLGSRMGRWRHHVNLGRTCAKLERLIQQFSFGRMCDVIRQVEEQEDAPLVWDAAVVAEQGVTGAAT
jgi:polysaccharide deacetylase family protein (PEP-CTERM system associated)